MLAAPPTDITGRYLRLEPLTLAHIPALEKTCGQPEQAAKVWTYLMDAHLFREGGIPLVVETFRARKREGTDLPFAMVVNDGSAEQGTVIGITRFLEIDEHNNSIEIGTLISPDFQRRGFNFDSKLLMIGMAFEHYHMERVHFKVDVRNEASMKAVLALGAQHEGTLRRHIKMPDGIYRTSAVYSILKQEAGRVRALIRVMLDEQAQSTSATAP